MISFFLNYEFNTYINRRKEANTSKKYIDTKQSNRRNNQNSKDKRQDYNMK